MSEVFSARLNTRTNVKTAVDGLPFKAPGERYTVDDAHRLHLGLKRILTGTFNPAGGGTGMAALLRSSTDAINPSELAAVKSTDTAVAAPIIQKKLEADTDAAKAAGKKADDIPTMSLSDAHEEADRANHLIQAVIGAKEGIVLGLKDKLGERIANTVL